MILSCLSKSIPCGTHKYPDPNESIHSPEGENTFKQLLKLSSRLLMIKLPLLSIARNSCCSTELYPTSSNEVK